MQVRQKIILASVISALICALSLLGCSSSGSNGEDNINNNAPKRPVIYQLVVRYFSNISTTNAKDGDVATNGVGKFDDINEAAIESLKNMGITHIWLTGVLRQATSTAYPGYNIPADDPDILKGKAGSFYAVKDYYDVCPDYAKDPAKRLDEFKALINRIHAAGLRAIIDIVPNHVARTYHSDVRPEEDFGKNDDSTKFFAANNNFYYLVDPLGQSVCLPSTSECATKCGSPDAWVWEGRPAGCDCTVESEKSGGSPGVPRATGDNGTSANVSSNSWYETVKLNYGFNFVTGEKVFDPTPDTWTKMDKIIAYWQQMGVDGFRCDFAHYVPTEFWRWAIAKAKERNKNVYFFAEAYENLSGLLEAGFNAVYDDSIYDATKKIFCCGGWANDVDAAMGSDFTFKRLLRYGENHDERRIASPITGTDPNNSGLGSAQAGMPFSTLMYLSGGGPVMLFNGQEVGEPGAGAEGFGGDDGRTTIFDYWSMPAMTGWVNGFAYDGGAMLAWQASLRGFYRDLLNLANEEPFRSGQFYGLNFLNKNSAGFGGGHYVYAFLRYNAGKKNPSLILVNFSADTDINELVVKLNTEALSFAGFASGADFTFVFSPVFGFGEETEIDKTTLINNGVKLSLPKLGFAVYNITAK